MVFRLAWWGGSFAGPGGAVGLDCWVAGCDIHAGLIR